jgi:serine/threonine protein kinase
MLLFLLFCTSNVILGFISPIIPLKFYKSALKRVIKIKRLNITRDRADLFFDESSSKWSSSRANKVKAVNRVFSEFGFEGINRLKAQKGVDCESVDEIVRSLDFKLSVRTEKVLGPRLRDLVVIVDDKISVSRTVKGRSKILKCVLRNRRGGKVRAKLKIVKDDFRYRNEIRNIQSICGKKGGNGFVEILGYEDEVKDASGGTILMEEGLIDMKELVKFLGPLRDGVLKTVGTTMCNSLKTIHQKGYVWSDLRLENFVICPTDPDIRFTVAELLRERPTQSSVSTISKFIVERKLIVRGIDLESAVRIGEIYTDISPEIIAPEQADLLTRGQLSSGSSGEFRVSLEAGQLADLKASQKTDIWALGISILHLYLGSAPIVEGLDLSSAIKKVSTFHIESQDSDLGLSQLSSNWLSLTKSMLNRNPSLRPTLSQITFQMLFM